MSTILQLMFDMEYWYKIQGLVRTGGLFAKIWSSVHLFSILQWRLSACVEQGPTLQVWLNPSFLDGAEIENMKISEEQVGKFDRAWCTLQ